MRFFCVFCDCATGGGLEVPLCKVFARLHVEVALEAADVVSDDGEVLVLDGGADLHDGRAAVNELQRRLGRIAAARGQDGEARQRAGDGGDCPERHGPRGVARHAAVRGALLAAHSGPRVAVALHAHQRGHRVDGRHARRAPVVRRARNDRDVSHVGRQLGKEWDGAHFLQPAADFKHKLRILPARQTHAPLAHAVGAAEVELQRVGAACLCHFGELLPVLLVEAAHDACDHHLLREVRLQLRDGLAPVRRALLADEFNVQEGCLTGPVNRTRCAAPDDAGADVCDQVLVQRKRLGDGKAPPKLERAPDHVRGCAGRCGSKAEGVGEVDAAHVHRNVDQVDGRVEEGQLGRHRHGSVAGSFLDEAVDGPARHFAVVGGLHGGAVAGDIAAGKHPLGVLGLQGAIVHAGRAVLEPQRQARGRQRILAIHVRPEGRHNPVALHTHKLVFIDDVAPRLVDVHLVELHRHHAAVPHLHRLGLHVWHELAPLVLCKVALLRHSPYVGHTATERDHHAARATSEG
mmetsp:Transcript_11752/g.29695  ORF Transcript_11752/g.29695 Transcript_11752/m.29695 type:complete len:519 (+) Transcript_11752:748-2304(+)